MNFGCKIPGCGKPIENREEWRDIAGYESYQVSNFGSVRTLGGRTVQNSKQTVRKTVPRILSLGDNGHGYKLIYITIDRKHKSFSVHRLVATAFIPNPLNLPHVNHKDGNKSNNHISNLEWVSMKDNMKHAAENDLVPHGDRAPWSKLKESTVIDILNHFKSNPEASKLECAEKYGLSDGTIHSILKGKTWVRTSKKWKREQGIAA